MYKYKPVYSIVSILAVVAGFLISFWPLSVAGVLGAAAAGRYLTAVMLGLCMDILYGAPVGYFSWVPVPFTLLAACACGLQYLFAAYFLRRDSGLL